MSLEIVLPKIGTTNEVEAPASGTRRIVARVGETFEVGTELGYIE